MKPFSLEYETLLEEDLYEYKNNIATYYLRFIPLPEMSYKYELLCDRANLEADISYHIDQWKDPQLLDSLDIKLLVFEIGYQIYFLHPYMVEIQLGEVIESPAIPNYTLESRIILPYEQFHRKEAKNTIATKKKL